MTTTSPKNIIELLRAEAGDEMKGLLLAASLAGATSAGILALVNHVATSLDGENKVQRFVLFGLTLVLFIICSRRTYHRITELIEAALEKMKLRVIDKIAKAELLHLERVGTSVIQDRITENISVISDSASSIAGAAQSLAIVAFAVLYVLSISLPAFVLLVLLNAATLLLESARKVEIHDQLDRAGNMRLRFLDQLADLLKGFKELRFSRKRSRDIRADMKDTVHELRSATVKANSLFADTIITAQCLQAAMLASMVFVLPEHITVASKDITALISGILLLWTQLGYVLSGLPQYTRSNLALKNIELLEKDLDRAVQSHVPEHQTISPWADQFSKIEVTGVSFAYPADEKGQCFAIGPLDLSIAAGEVIFVVGGNGSGKSTFMKVLTGLYAPTGGQITVDGHRLRPQNVAAYREMISAIFSDFHLFSRLYGLLDADEAEVANLLRQMQIDHRTSFVDGRFTKRDLSTGQRKRLAMTVALLEDRPICLFDEWAADQDPEFRQYFYDKIIPSLKRRGKTVIAVSHDDRYFHCADRVVTLEYGKLRSVESTVRPPNHATRPDILAK